jgi:hypothetical protein
MSIITPVLQTPSQNHCPPCADYANWGEALFKAYADCDSWCLKKCPSSSECKHLSPSQISEMLKSCKRECRRYQSSSPANH